MSDLIRICSASEVPTPGQVAEFTVNGRTLCVANVDGSIAVLDGTCPHEGGPLGEGTIENGLLACPWHNYSFDPRTGICSTDASLKAEVIEARIESGELRGKL